MRLPVPNLGSALVDKFGKVIPPWNSWFQQFSEAPAPTIDITPTGTGFNYTASVSGTMYCYGGTGVTVFFSRSGVSFSVPTNDDLSTIVLSAGDLFAITYTTSPILKFVPN